jgi:hypothetical protein
MADISSWDAHDPAVWAEEVGSPPVAISLRHPSYPAEATCAANPGALRKVVAKYLGKVSNRLGLPDLFAAEDNFKVFMGWLDLPADDGGVDPRKSFWVARYEDPINRMGLIDRSVVFVAAESWRENDSAGVLGSRLGLRVVAHVVQQGSATWKVRITSVARSIGLPEALESHATLAAEANNFYSFVFNPANFLSFKAFITSATGLVSDRVAIEGVRVSTVGNSTSGTIYATESRRDEDPPGPGYALTLRFAIPPGTLFSKPTVERSALVAHAAQVKADLFTQDPASRAGLGKLIESRPNRSPERLNAFKYPNVELEGLHFDFGNHCLLIDDDLELADVRQSKIVAATANPDNTQGVVPADVDHPGQNEFAALGGYEHTRAKFNQRHLRPLFTTLIAYGLPPHDYFRFAASPLRIRYRSPITPGPGKDGKTVNAQVDFDPPRSSLIAEQNEWTEEERTPMHIRFALADLKRSASRRQPLGLAADPRWSWHEYCHVLLAAQTGKLELHFAHSAGDALAAILSDPRSALATHPWSRGYTFPWVYLHRRHDRAVNRGWGWTGPRHRQERFPANDCNCRHKGYDSEQILATSLFRLYRSLGGDTVEANGDPDRLARERAADYTAYLILKTISLMPPASFGAMQTPDQFATGLIDVDTGTQPITGGPLKDRVGGWAQKVVRWAFEAQGLYAANPLAVLNEPGLPPPVDVFIDDNRPDSEGTYTRGGYMPVSLDWSEPGPRPWHAAANAIRIAGNRITVEVRNRGRNVANGVTVSVWYIVRSAGATTPPNWKATTWTKIDESNPVAVPPWPAPAVVFPPFDAPPAQPAGKRVWILAIADCTADRANTNPATSYPCSTRAVSIVDLVAGDNNLGLRVLP